MQDKSIDFKAADAAINRKMNVIQQDIATHEAILEARKKREKEIQDFREQSWSFFSGLCVDQRRMEEIRAKYAVQNPEGEDAKNIEALCEILTHWFGYISDMHIDDFKETLDRYEQLIGKVPNGSS